MYLQENKPTPRIDAVLHRYRERVAGLETEQERNAKGVWPEGSQTQSYESRLIQLEEQLTSLLTKSKVDPMSRHITLHNSTYFPTA